MSVLHWLVVVHTITQTNVCCSEEKAKLLRRVGGLVDEKDQELITFMTSLQLDRLNIYSEPNRLPQVMP